MTKKVIYIAVAVGVVAIFALLFLRQQPKQLDERITLDTKYNKPYDLSVAYNNLPLLFNNPTVTINRSSPDVWYNSDSSADGKTLFFLVTRHFNPEESELQSLLDFVKQGNQVFISTPFMNSEAAGYFGFDEDYGAYKDAGKTWFTNPPYSSDTLFVNPGLHYTSSFSGVDSLHYAVIAKNEDGTPALIKVDAGKGSFYFQCNPFLLFNYFLLYRNNINYLEKIASLMPKQQDKIIWDEYYKYKLEKNDRGEPASPLHVLFGIPPFRWAFLIIIVLVLLRILLNVKRLQRIIPAWEKPKNDTLDFTKTIGRLYYAKGDNTNLARKMATYLLEFIRNKYFISTAALNDDFVKSLASKAGYSEELTKEMVGHLVYIQGEHKVSEKQLVTIYQSFSTFYKHTS